jgi:hypothetical protein
VLPVGSSRWVLFYSAEINNYVPKCEGRIDDVRGDRYSICGEWVLPDFPEFGSREEAEAYVAEHPFEAPTIKP